MDVVVREIVVPRRLLLRPGLLDEHVVVVEPNGAAAHELLRRIGCGGVGGHAPELVDGRPRAEVFHELPSVAGGAGHEEEGAGVGQDLGDASGDQRHVLWGKEASEADDAVPPKGLDLRRRQDPSACRHTSRLPFLSLLLSYEEEHEKETEAPLRL
jgi:hypothetical protein